MILCASEPIGCIDRNNNIANMTDEEFKQFIKDKGGTPEEVLAHEELWELVKPSLKNDFLAIDYYDNKPAYYRSNLLLRSHSLEKVLQVPIVLRELIPLLVCRLYL